MLTTSCYDQLLPLSVLQVDLTYNDSTMPAPRMSKSDHSRPSSSRSAGSPRRTISKPGLSSARPAAEENASFDSPARSVRTITSSSSDIRSRKSGSSRRASLSLGTMDPLRSSGTKSDHQTTKSDGKRVNRPGTVSPFLKITHRGLKDQIEVLQGHIKFVQNLAVMNDDKKVDLLFRMIDKDGGGTVDAAELATAMRQNAELSYSDSIEKAIDMVATFDVNGDGELDKVEFGHYLTAMVEKLQVSVSDFSEYLIVELLMSQETPEERQAGELARERINGEVKKREELFAALSNELITEAYEMLDTDSAGQVPFHRVAKALYQSIQTDDGAVQESLSVLLMSDTNDTRVLDYEQFGRLVLSASKATGNSVDTISEDLINVLECQSDMGETFNSSADEQTTARGDENVDSLTQARLQKLFDLWDADGDGDISVRELANGLGKFQKASGINVDPKAMAQALIKFDEDGDNQLDPREFTNAMIVYAKQFGLELHSVIDFMCISSAETNERASASRKLRSKNDNSDPWSHKKEYEDAWEN
jgi:Ca2+-binding EF-hand superfamily protein